MLNTISDIHALLLPSGVPATKVLGVPVSTIDMDQAVGTILGWISERKANYVCVRDVHGIMRAQDDPSLLEIHERAGMVTPDGMPLVWLARSRGHSQTKRVCGADLVDAMCRASVATNVGHFFYGGKPGVARRMAATLSTRHPGLKVTGIETPPFEPLTEMEDNELTERLAASSPGIIWVGLSTPKQEFWMRDHVDRIPGATLIGVGAAFDFYAGDVKRAPAWMHKNGFEWLHRLMSEPRRLWRRYLVLAPRFVWLTGLEERRSRSRKRD